MKMYRGKEGRVNQELRTDKNTLLILCLKEITSENVLSSPGNSHSGLCDDLKERESTRGEMCVHTVDSL